MHRRSAARAEREWLGAADRLFEEFPEVPLEAVVRAMNAARGETGGSPNPHLVVARARELLFQAGHRADCVA